MEEGKKKKTVKVLIITLSVLLVISLVSLVGILIFKRFAVSKPASVTVSDNIITHEKENSDISSAPESPQGVGDNSASASSGASYESERTGKALYLHSRVTGDNTPFKVTNMFPGDSETNYYCIRVSHKGDVVLRFRANVRPGHEKLAEALYCRIALTHSGEVLYDGPMQDMPNSITHALNTEKSTISEVNYEITAYLDTSVGNEYMNKDLIADFRWWVEETGNLDSPQTGDSFNLYLWLCIAVGSLFLLILLWKKRKKEDAANER
ncbi:MAG: LPXTG cell wall anchor domain-containing protein [Acutalibacteraceae bacterium]